MKCRTIEQTKRTYITAPITIGKDRNLLLTNIFKLLYLENAIWLDFPNQVKGFIGKYLLVNFLFKIKPRRRISDPKDVGALEPRFLPQACASSVGLAQSMISWTGSRAQIIKIFNCLLQIFLFVLFRYFIYNFSFKMITIDLKKKLYKYEQLNCYIVDWTNKF